MQSGLKGIGPPYYAHSRLHLHKCKMCFIAYILGITQHGCHRNGSCMLLSSHQAHSSPTISDIVPSHQACLHASKQTGREIWDTRTSPSYRSDRTHLVPSVRPVLAVQPARWEAAFEGCFHEYHIAAGISSDTKQRSLRGHSPRTVRCDALGDLTACSCSLLT